MKQDTSRRAFIKTLGAGAAGLALASKKKEAVAKAWRDAATTTTATFTHKLGDFELCLLSDRQGEIGFNILIGATEAMEKECAPKGRIPNAMNAFLVKAGNKRILLDTGLGTGIVQNLHSLGVSPGEIDCILITHEHGDHIGGMLKDGRMQFPRAEVYISQIEHDYWMKSSNPLPTQVAEAYKKQLQLFRPGTWEQGETLLPGFKAIAAYGHTPGHTVYLLESAGERLLVWGDLAHAMAIQMPYPDVAVTYDTDPQEAIASRKAALAYVTANRIPIAGMHIAYPAMGKIEKENGKAYRFIPFS